ncbi:alpha/beta hydrolase [Ancylothrix sp. C2]|uniref:alpha/beta fold hydrolase n=1 Tax=Ancylothrix sp. D3o TaxID=2953691 RepID=UPI0021BAA9C1|nr:alpha/beta hydrolase [Ancylothrix sp. D3o]MCT7952097.1 alpha/beta hydrolase [Ancylothrix sp. D3o]
MPEIISRPCLLTPKPLRPDFPLFVFLPGMDGTGKLLRSQLGYLEVAFDIRSLAISPGDLTSWQVLAGEVVGLIEAELEGKKQRPVYLCGESFGGCLALQVIQRAPHLIDRLILINPASSFNRQPLLHFGSHLVALLPQPIYPYSAAGLVPFLAAWERMKTSDLEELMKAMENVPQKTTLWRLSLLREFHISTDQLRNIWQPTLLIAGAADRLLPSVSEAKQLVSRLPNAKMVTLPNSGHACLLEADVDLFKILKNQDFIEIPTRQRAGKSAILK